MNFVFSVLTNAPLGYEGLILFFIGSIAVLSSASFNWIDDTTRSHPTR